MQDSLDKAESIYKAAERCFQAGLYDSCVSRSYYAMFWAAIAALERAGHRVGQEWSHGGLLNTFSKHLVHTRKLYPALYGRRLRESYKLRSMADYERVPLGQKKAKRALKWAHEFIRKVREVTND